MFTPEERVASLEAAYYRYSHDRDRMAGLLVRVAELLLLEQPPGRPHQHYFRRWEWHAQQRCSRMVRQFADELLAAERSP